MKIFVSKDYLSILIGVFKVKENKSKISIENVYFDFDFELNLIKKIENVNKVV